MLESCKNAKKNVQKYHESYNKKPNWLKVPNDRLYAQHLVHLTTILLSSYSHLTRDALEIIQLKFLIDTLGEDLYGRLDSQITLASSPVMTWY